MVTSLLFLPVIGVFLICFYFQPAAISCS